MPKPCQPNFVLDVEISELFIQAGLQDRVIQVRPQHSTPHIILLHSFPCPLMYRDITLQVYEGLVYMDFDKAVMETQNHGGLQYCGLFMWTLTRVVMETLKQGGLQY